MDLSTFAKVTLGAVCLSVAALAAQDGPRTNGANLPVRTDANGYLIVAEQTYTAPDGPRRVLANALVRTDANGYLIVTNPAAFGSGTFAPIGAQYWVAVAHADLTAEVDLSALSTGLVLNTGGTPSQYAGSSCTNQFVRSLDVSAAATCAAVVLGTDTTGTLDHGTALTGLSDDDHTQYLLASGTRALSGNWDAGSFTIRAQILESDIVTGTAPLTIASTTVVTNLNVDALDGISSAGFLQADGSIALTANWDVGAFEVRALTVQSDQATGTAPFVVASTTVTSNLNADLLDGVQGAEFLQRDGSVPLTANWDAGAFEVRAETLQSDVATGTAPLIVASTTLVSNLNADLLDGISIAGIAQVTGTPVDNQIAVWTGAGTIEGNAAFAYVDPVWTYASVSTSARLDVVLDSAVTISGMTELGRMLFNAGAVGMSELTYSADQTDATRNSDFAFVVRSGGSGQAMIWSGENGVGGNLRILSAALPSGGSGGIVFADGTALSSMGTNTAGLYANDVSGTVEMFAIDEAGAATQISPHNFTLFTPDAAEPFPWSYYSRNPYLGIEINVDIAKLARLVEQLTGEQIIYTRALPATARLQWLEEQQRHARNARVAYEAWEERRDAFEDTPIDSTFDELPPAPPVVKLPPAWLLSRLEDLGHWDRSAFATEQARLRQWTRARRP